ncbi:MAG TPA: DUF2330 domain-containing protein [Planctomycetes bacterium]|nr:DUF2330 domain-containing protein [Planctomycetota bacterium]
MKIQSRIKHCLLFWVLGFCCVALMPREVYADGKYFPERAYKIPPTIPSQRAVLVYKEGTETLIIESALEGQGIEFGWIIPLPEKPTKFEEASPGFIKTLSLTIQPEIVHDLTSGIFVACVIAVFVTLLFLIVIAPEPQKPRRYSVLEILVVFVIVLLLLSILMPTMGGHAGGRGVSGIFINIPGIEIHDIEEIGNFEVTVLEADSTSALDVWLSVNGFAGLSENDKIIVFDYIESGWYFVAAKLRREGSGYSRPHPIAMTFRSGKPLYPIRLTSQVGSDVYLELFVIAEKKATASNLTLELCDDYSFDPGAGQNFRGKKLPGFVGNVFRQNIGHPNANHLMWDGCVLSKLCATLNPTQMRKDILLELKSGSPFQKHYYSRRGAIGTGLINCLGWWCVSIAILTATFYKRIKGENGSKFALVRIAIPTALVSLLLWGITYAAVPKIEVETKGGRNRLIDRLYERATVFMEKEAIARGYSYFEGASKSEVEEIIEDYCKFTVRRNRYTKEKVKQEDSPGNYTIFENERGVVLRTYSREGFPDDAVITSASKDNFFDDYEIEAGRIFDALVKASIGGSWPSHLNRVLHFRPWDYEYNAILIKCFRRQPKELVPIILRRLKERLDWLPESIEEVEYEASMLGSLTRMEPPLDVTDTKKMYEFIGKIEVSFVDADG